MNYYIPNNNRYIYWIVIGIYQFLFGIYRIQQILICILENNWYQILISIQRLIFSIYRIIIGIIQNSNWYILILSEYLSVYTEF